MGSRNEGGQEKKEEKDQKWSKLQYLMAQYQPWPFCNLNALDKDFVHVPIEFIINLRASLPKKIVEKHQYYVNLIFLNKFQTTYFSNNYMFNLPTCTLLASSSKNIYTLFF